MTHRDKLMRILVVAPNLPWVFVPLPYGPTIEQGFRGARAAVARPPDFLDGVRVPQAGGPAAQRVVLRVCGRTTATARHARRGLQFFVRGHVVRRRGRQSGARAEAVESRQPPRLVDHHERDDQPRGAAVLARLRRPQRTSTTCSSTRRSPCAQSCWYAPYHERADRSVVLHGEKNETYRARAVPPEHWRTLQHVSHVLAPSDRSRVALRLALGNNVSVLNMPAPSTIWNRPDPPGATVRADVGADRFRRRRRAAPGRAASTCARCLACPRAAGPVVVVLAKKAGCSTRAAKASTLPSSPSTVPRDARARRLPLPQGALGDGGALARRPAQARAGVRRAGPGITSKRSAGRRSCRPARTRSRRACSPTARCARSSCSPTCCCSQCARRGLGCRCSGWALGTPVVTTRVGRTPILWGTASW